MLCVKAKITFEILFLLILNVIYSKVILFIFSKVLSNFKIYEQAYHGSKFSGEWLQDLNLVVC